MIRGFLNGFGLPADVWRLHLSILHHERIRAQVSRVAYRGTEIPGDGAMDGHVLRSVAYGTTNESGGNVYGHLVARRFAAAQFVSGGPAQRVVG